EPGPGSQSIPSFSFNGSVSSQSASVKKNLRLFNGFPFLLKLVCSILDLEKKGTHQDLIDRILIFLIAPRNSGKKKLVGGDSLAKKKKSISRASGTKKSKPGSKSKAIVMDSSSDEDDDEKVEAEAGGSDAEEKRSEQEEEEEQTDQSESDEDSSDEDEPLIRMVKKAPTDEQLRKTVESLLKEADLEEMTMKQICLKVFDTYPEHDLSGRKDFIKQTVKTVKCDHFLISLFIFYTVFYFILE
uniref:DEK-C domain-containing protein n=1 Tax=Xiphophorus couchianus TaxID=32473 RepID=A0A3B5MZV2_9TELE